MDDALRRTLHKLVDAAFPSRREAFPSLRSIVTDWWVGTYPGNIPGRWALPRELREDIAAQNVKLRRCKRCKACIFLCAGASQDPRFDAQMRRAFCSLSCLFASFERRATHLTIAPTVGPRRQRVRRKWILFTLGAYFVDYGEFFFVHYWNAFGPNPIGRRMRLKAFYDLHKHKQ